MWRKVADGAVFTSPTSFSSPLSSTLTGSEWCKRFMSSSLSILGPLNPLLRDELFASLIDSDIVLLATTLSVTCELVQGIKEEMRVRWVQRREGREGWGGGGCGVWRQCPFTHEPMWGVEKEMRVR
ncbi:hypothetical protein ACFX2I_040834 [Malus domestica]